MAPRDKDKARGFLRDRDLEGILAWARSERGAVRNLVSLIFEDDEIMRWRAIEALGRVAAMKAKKDLDSVRTLVSRLLWFMNDESGNSGWHAPEAIGEIIANVPSLIGEYGEILVSFFHEEPFERGSHWAVARAAARCPEVFVDAAPKLAASANDPDPFIRSCAILALRAMKAPSALEGEVLDALKIDESPVRMYDFEKGELMETTVGDIAKEL